MNICIEDWNGATHCLGSLMAYLPDTAAGGVEAGIGVFILVCVTLGIFIFRDPA